MGWGVTAHGDMVLLGVMECSGNDFSDDCTICEYTKTTKVYSPANFMVWESYLS